ncbi:MAG: signal peptidase II [Lautropia sp.]
MPEANVASDKPRGTAGSSAAGSGTTASGTATGQPALWPYLLVALVVIVLDQISKHAVVARFAFGERLGVVPGWFDLTLLYNRGAAFSFLAGHDGWQRWFFAAIAIAASVFILYLLLRHRGERGFSTGLALILGGALGNLYDRLAYGQVTDFLLFYRGDWYFPAFNLADSAITAGAVLLIVDELLRMRGRRPAG